MRPITTYITVFLLQNSEFHDFIADFEVVVEYRDNGEYTLTAIGDEGKAGTPVQASCWAEEEVVAEGEEEGAELDGNNLVMTGFLGEKRVVANIATVDNKLHIFTNVSCLPLSFSQRSREKYF